MADKKGGNTGKNKKSDNVLHREGNFRKDRHGDPERKVSFDNELKSSNAPDWLTPDAAKVWRNLTGLFAGKEVVFENSYYSLANLCALQGHIITMNGLVTVAHFNATRIAAQAFGLDPVSLGRLETPAKEAGKSRFELTDEK